MSIDPALFRQTVGTFGSGVTVVTTGSDGVYAGMTANAFASVSLEPTLILLCMALGSQTLQLLQESKRFNISILSSQQEAVSRLFATKSENGSDKLQQVPFDLGENGLPLIREATAHLECRLSDSHLEGDHIILIGEVDRASFDTESQPLIFFRGAYREIATPQTA